MNYIERINQLLESNNLKSVEYNKVDEVLQVRAKDIEFFNYHHIDECVISELAEKFGRPANNNKWEF